MNPASAIQRFLLERLDIRGAVVKLSDVWQSLQRGRDWSPVVAGLLGELAAVSAIIAGNLKQPGRLSFQMQGSGPVTLLLVDCSESLNLRGMARAEGPSSGSDLPSLLGDGRLQLTLNLPGLERPYQSLVPLEGHSMAEVFVHYLEQSEQQPAGLWLACDPAASAALFLQKLPGADAKDPDGWNRALTLAGTVQESELLGLDTVTLLRRLFAEEDVRLYPARAITHDWPREPEKIAAMLRALGEEEVRATLAEHGEVLVRDELSNHTYRFDAVGIESIFRAVV